MRPKTSGANNEGKKCISPVQLTTSRIGNFTRPIDHVTWRTNVLLYGLIVSSFGYYSIKSKVTTDKSSWKPESQK